jgi:signal-transduction protein with cAMP-binding, CBS, and nucleotidyltransferase domain
VATETLERKLREHPFVTDMSDDQLRFLLGCTKNARFKAGDFVVREGQPANTLYLLRKGRVALESHLPGRGRVVVETMDSGDVMGWSVLFPPYRWNLDGRALDETVAFAVDGVCLRDKLEADHSFGYAVTRRLLYEVHARLDHARLQQLDVYRSEPA